MTANVGCRLEGLLLLYTRWMGSFRPFNYCEKVHSKRAFGLVGFIILGVLKVISIWDISSSSSKWTIYLWDNFEKNLWAVFISSWNTDDVEVRWRDVLLMHPGPRAFCPLPFHGRHKFYFTLIICQISWQNKLESHLGIHGEVKIVVTQFWPIGRWGPSTSGGSPWDLI